FWAGWSSLPSQQFYRRSSCCRRCASEMQSRPSTTITPGRFGNIPPNHFLILPGQTIFRHQPRFPLPKRCCEILLALRTSFHIPLLYIGTCECWNERLHV